MATLAAAGAKAAAAAAAGGDKQRARDQQAGAHAKEEMVRTRKLLESCGKGDLPALKALLFPSSAVPATSADGGGGSGGGGGKGTTSNESSAAPAGASKKEADAEAAVASRRVARTRDANGKSPLHFAAAAGRTATCHFLIDLVRGKDGAAAAYGMVNATDDDGSTPLALCVAAAPDDTVAATTRCLLASAANPTLANKRGVTPLHRAAGEGHCDVMAALLDNQASKQRVDMDRMSDTGSALHWAAAHKRLDAIALLAERGAALDQPNAAGLAPIMVAAAVGAGDVVQALARAGASTAGELPGGITLLHMCTEVPDDSQSLTAVRAVMETEAGRAAVLRRYTPKGAAAGASAAQGLLPIELAARVGNTSVVELLRAPSASVLGTLFDGAVGDANASVANIMAAGAKARAEAEAAAEAAQERQAAQAASSSSLPGDVSAPMATVLPRVTRPAANPENAAKAAALKDAGNAHFRANDLAAAIKCYTEGIELDGANQVLWSNRCACHLKQRHWDAAVFDASAALHIKSDWHKARVRLGKAFMGLERYEDAAVALWEVVQKTDDKDPTKETVTALFQKCIKKARKQHQAKQNSR